jgi:signal peptidase I
VIRRVFDFFKSILIASVVAALMIMFVIETVSVEGNSMFPTFEHKDRLVIEKIAFHLTKPKVNDIVVFKYPADTREKFIKRVIALPGDTVKIENSKLYVNGVVREEYYLNERMTTSFFNEVKVPQNTIFVLGDNRNYSKDSRSPDVGFISEKLLVGRAVLKIYPINNIGRVR